MEKMNEDFTVNIDKDKMLESDLIKDYINEIKDTLKNSFPNINEEKLEKIVQEELIKTVKKVPVVEFKNNYTKKNKKVTLLGWYKWYKQKKPITTEHGVCFKKHNEAINLSAKLLEYILDTRKYHKKKMLECKDKGDLIGAKFHDVRQKVFKIFANSYYGATGNAKSVFYNLYTALSITGKGQSLITNAATSFEQFLTDNIYFNNLDDILVYIRNVKHDERKFKDSDCLTKQITKEKLVDRLVSKFYDKKEGIKNREEIERIVKFLSKKDLNRIYYKNNLYEFCKCKKVLNLIYEIMDKTESFKNPNEVPDEIKDDIQKLWDWMKEFVYYPHSLFNRISICKKMKRKCVVTVDTDSNMINTEPWIDFLVDNSNGKYNKLELESEDIFKMVNIIAYILGHMIGEVHERYTKDCNVPEDKRPIINMKNEFLMRRILLTENKKNYSSIQWLQEGVVVPESKSLDIKGLSIKKANVNKNVSNQMQKFMEDDILRSKTIDINSILKNLNGLEKDIRKSFLNGEVKYAKPDKSNEPGSYKTPFQIQAVRGIYTWNKLYPDKEITYPAQVNLIKLKNMDVFELKEFILRIFQIDNGKSFFGRELEQDYTEKLEIVEELLSDDNIGKYGFTVIAIPKTEESIPEWIIPFIDVDTIVFDSMNNFNKILGSIGVKTIGTNASDMHYSNIIDF